MHRVRHIEYHVAHGCNLTCESCTHFSQDGHSGRCTPESFLSDLGPWADRIIPDDFLLLGGEPLLNPQLLEVIPLARGLWPTVRMQLVTNGLLLPKRPGLARVLNDANVQLSVSIHHDSPEYLTMMRTVKDYVDKMGLTAPINWRHSHRDWTRAYRGYGKDVMPYTDNDQLASWKACVSKWCMNIHEGKLYKCPVAAYLPMQQEKFGLHESWAPYLAYRPLDPACSETDLVEFIARRAECVCTMCPAKPEHFEKPNPMRRSLV